MIPTISPTTNFSYLQESLKAEKPCDCGACPECAAKAGSKMHDRKAMSVSISSEGHLLAEGIKSEGTHTGTPDHKANHSETPGHKAVPSDEEQSEESLKQIEALKRSDREVRAHETAHLMAAGNLALGGPSFDYQKGPDGKQYAVGGEVQIDTSPVEGDPEATIRKAARIQAAANAPADPSSQDRSVASQAATMALKAQAELAEQNKETQEDEADPGNVPVSPYDKKSESGLIIDLVA